MKPRLLDLFCGAGGTAKGYQRAGFYVVGVDIKPQPRYAGNEFVLADAVTVDLDGYDVIHASPPCQDYSALKAFQSHQRPRLVPVIRDRLRRAGVPYVIENVVGSELEYCIVLCGSSFGLGVRRHRLFEMSHPPSFWPQCEHDLQPEPIDVTGHRGAVQWGAKIPRRWRESQAPESRARA